MNKILTFGIPCYNSEAYMDHCITSILEGCDYAEDIEIIIVDDGSQKDSTPAKADEWQARYPHIIRAIHQENGGHGKAVMKAVTNAEGLYFKNIDSDDWVDTQAVATLLKTLRDFAAREDLPDLVFTNYVYEHVEDNTQNRVDYVKVLPKDKMFTWDNMGKTALWQYLLMHALCYRVEILKLCNLDLPPHTFYVDNLYAYIPLPFCKKLYYLDVDLYRYFIGRDDQSVNEQMLIKRIDHYWRVARGMIRSYHLYDEIESDRLRTYMMNFITIVMGICSLFAKMAGTDEALREQESLWEEFKAYDEKMYHQARHRLVGMATNLPGALGKAIMLKGYRIAQKIVKFN